MKNMTKVQEGMIRAAVGMGLSDREAAALIGIGRESIRLWRKKHEAEHQKYRADQAKCRTCRYSWQYTPSNIVLCDFLEITGRRRGCPPGAGCKEFVRK